MIINHGRWILNPRFDLVFILLPPIVVSFTLFFFSRVSLEEKVLGDLGWLVFIVFIDVAHVWSTLYRTYFHQKNFQRNKVLLTLTPIMVWVTGVVIYGVSSSLFWTLLAYLAVFHFIRQQYGFLRIYAAGKEINLFDKKFDIFFIYLLTIYPMVYWHTHLPRNFEWMIRDDFLMGLPLYFEKYLFWIYIAAASIYLAKEIFFLFYTKSFNVAKNLIVLGTGLSWYVGIVYFNGDFTFTVTNVIAHGVPYMALVWSKEKEENQRFLQTFSPVIFLGLILVCAVMEEILWESLIWREHMQKSSLFSFLPQVINKELKTLFVTLLIIPQVTHYVIDGFIWKGSKK